MRYKEKRIVTMVMVAGLMVADVLSPAAGDIVSAAAKVKLDKKKISVIVKKKVSVKVKNAGKKKVKASIAKKKIAAVRVKKNKLTITGKKVGKTKLTVSVKGMKKCSIPVTVKRAKKSSSNNNEQQGDLQNPQTPVPTAEPAKVSPIINQPVPTNSIVATTKPSPTADVTTKPSPTVDVTAEPSPTADVTAEPSPTSTAAASAKPSLQPEPTATAEVKQKAGKITIDEAAFWESLLETISFNLYKAKETTVSIESYLPDSQIYYFIDTSGSKKAKTKEELDTVTDWLEYKDAFVLNDDKNVIYAKIVDAENNVEYISSNGIVTELSLVEPTPTPKTTKPPKPVQTSNPLAEDAFEDYVKSDMISVSLDGKT